MKDVRGTSKMKDVRGTSKMKDVRGTSKMKGMKEIGSGVSSVVYENNGMAVKTIIPEDDDIQLPILFVRELTILSGISHPNIILFKNISINKGNIEIWMDLAENNLLYFSDYSFDQLKQISLDIGCALSFCKTNSILHRDIKLENILIYREDNRATNVGAIPTGIRAVLCDFGLAKCGITDAIPLSDQVYTEMYRPIEIYYGQRYDYSSEAWCYCCILYRIFCNSNLFSRIPGKTIVDTIENVIANKSYLACPFESLKMIFARIFIKEMNKRMTIDEIILSDFFHSCEYPIINEIVIEKNIVIRSDILRFYDFILDHIIFLRYEGSVIELLILIFNELKEEKFILNKNLFFAILGIAWDTWHIDSPELAGLADDSEIFNLQFEILQELLEKRVNLFVKQGIFYRLNRDNIIRDKLYDKAMLLLFSIDFIRLDPDIAIEFLKQESNIFIGNEINKIPDRIKRILLFSKII